MPFAPVLNSELIFSTLFTVLQGCYQFTTSSRLLRHWSEVIPSEQPALFMTQRDPVVKQTERMPDIWTLGADVYLYAQQPDQETSVDPTLNAIIDAVRSILQPSGADAAKYGVNTLNQLVKRLWIEGNIQTAEGALGGQGVAIIPVKMTWPPNF
jgi:hypothetical protein